MDGAEWDLREVDLSGLDLRGGKFQRVRRASCDLMNAWLDDANLEEAVLNNADPWRDQLPGVRLRHAKLIHADLRSANMTGADLTGTELAFATMVTAQASGIRLQGATYNLHTQMPQGVDLEHSGMRLERAEE